MLRDRSACSTAESKRPGKPAATRVENVDSVAKSLQHLDISMGVTGRVLVTVRMNHEVARRRKRLRPSKHALETSARDEMLGGAARQGRNNGCTRVICK